MNEKFKNCWNWLKAKSTLAGIWGFNTGVFSTKAVVNYEQGEDYGLYVASAVAAGVAAVCYIVQGIMDESNKESSKLEQELEDN